MRKLLILDDTPKVEILLKEILEADGDKFDVRKAADKVDVDIAINKQKPEMMIVNTGSGKAMSVLKPLIKRNDCPSMVLFGKNTDVIPSGADRSKIVDIISLPFEPVDFCERIDDDIFKATGRFDEQTGLFKKTWFDFKMEKMLRKNKIKGTMFCMSIDAYSFAANPPTKEQIQKAIAALKENFSNGILAANKTMVVGFFPSDKPREENTKYINHLIDIMCKAADEPPIYVCAGASETEMYGYSAEDTYVFANKAMGPSIKAGKNCVTYYK